MENKNRNKKRVWLFFKIIPLVLMFILIYIVFNSIFK